LSEAKVMTINMRPKCLFCVCRLCLSLFAWQGRNWRQQRKNV